MVPASPAGRSRSPAGQRLALRALSRHQEGDPASGEGHENAAHDQGQRVEFGCGLPRNLRSHTAKTGVDATAGRGLVVAVAAALRFFAGGAVAVVVLGSTFAVLVEVERIIANTVEWPIDEVRAVAAAALAVVVAFLIQADTLVVRVAVVGP